MAVTEVVESVEKSDVTIVLVNRDNFRDVADELTATLVSNGYEGMYFTVDRTFEEIRECISYRDADTEKLLFLDLVGKQRGLEVDDDRVTLIESPTAFNDIMISFDKFLERLEREKTFVLLDSFTAYMLHGQLKEIGNFVKRLTDHARENGTKFVVLALKQQINEDILERFMTFCDEKCDMAEET